MPRNYELTWNAKQHRWFKKFNGKQYSISCKELGTPPTKEASYLAALEWWNRKKADLQVAPLPAERPLHVKALIAEHNKVIRALERAGFNTAELLQLPADNRLNLIGAVFEQRELIHEIAPNSEKALAFHIEAYRRKAQEDTESGIIKPGRYGKLHNSLKWLTRFTSEQGLQSIDVIDANLLDTYYAWLTKKWNKEKVLAVHTARDHWQVFRVWVEWLAERKVVSMPLNINAQRFRFQLPKVKYRYWSKAEFQQVYQPAQDRLKLYLLLMANCGFYASDIGCLRKSELDLRKGTITRQRTKTGEDIDTTKYCSASNVPVTQYFLWPETLKLLKAQLSDDSTLALLNEDGTPLWKDGVHPDGRYWKTDNIVSMYKRLLSDKVKHPKPNTLENLRKTSAQRLSDSQYKDCANTFGGWAEKTVREQNYTEIPPERFKKALTWLRTKYLS